MQVESAYAPGALEAPVVRFVDTMINQAILQSASDIHVEPMRTHVTIRFRIDGILHDQQLVELSYKQRIVSRIKILASIDISQSRLPQDGRFGMKIGARDIDFRVSTFPVEWGEKVVIRILDRSAQMIALDQLGFSQQMHQQLMTLLQKSQGFFLISGPTGSGKTTTLYAALSLLNKKESHIITLEDPVEYRLDGVMQSHINPEIGFTFVSGLRSLLRQDPDVVMVGEIRDPETARIAVQASLTGHFVLSTIHTNDAPSAIIRLRDMGIEPYLLSASLSGIVAQRLVRKLCQACKAERSAHDFEKEFFTSQSMMLESVYDAPGCSACKGRGYSGRIAVAEYMMLTPAVRSMIGNGAQYDQIVAQAIRDGMAPLLHDGIAKAKTGLVSVKELMRAA